MRNRTASLRSGLPQPPTPTYLLSQLLRTLGRPLWTPPAPVDISGLCFWPIAGLLLCAGISGIDVLSRHCRASQTMLSVACVGMAWHRLALRLRQFFRSPYVLTRAASHQISPVKSPHFPPATWVRCNTHGNVLHCAHAALKAVAWLHTQP